MSIINEPSVDLHLKLNEQSFHIPYTLLKRNYKLFNELLDKEALHLNKKFQEFNKLSLQLPNDDELKKNIQNDKLVVTKLNNIIKSIDIFERKIDKIVNIELEILNRIDKRIKFFKELNQIKLNQNQADLISWYQNYTNILISDYLIRNGSILDSKSTNLLDDSGSGNSGVTFLKQQALDDLLDYNILLNANKICKSLVELNELNLLIDWINDNKKYLNKKNSNLEFLTRLQQFIEYLKIGDYNSAIDCLQNYLIKFLNSNFNDLKIAGGLLVYIDICQNFKNSSTGTNNDNITKINGNLSNATEMHTKANSILSLINNDAMLNNDKNSKFNYFFRRNSPFENKNDSMKNYNIANGGNRNSTDNLNLNQNYNINNEAFFYNQNNLMDYMKLLDDNNWNKLNDLFLEEYYSLYGISTNEPLLIYLSLGISSLKTKACLQHNNIIPQEYNHILDNTINQYQVKNSCPVCSSIFREITMDMPYAHHTGSRLFENPVMLPNGNIFDSKKLKLLSQIIKKKGIQKLKDNEVFDPIDKQIYLESDFIKMFPT